MGMTSGPEGAVLVGVATRQISARAAKEHLSELGRLADTAGAKVLESILQRRDALDPSTVVGSGKVEEIRDRARALCADMVVFDEDLSASQAKKLEAAFGLKVLDRSGLILDIFAKHARTAEAKIQVEVAQLEYLLPRLTRAWTHLSRQVGGIGTRGPGETQLEVDRRSVRKRIADLRRKLEKLESVRSTQIQRREPTFHASLVGYTNAGKSTLMNALAKGGVEAADRLFATLDSTTRRLFLGGSRKAVLSDTVGFIRKLPVALVSSFKSTLGVASQASALIHVLDAAAEDFEEQSAITAGILAELGTEHLPRHTVFNKIDLLDPERLEALRTHYPDALFVSAEAKIGLEPLRERLRAVYDERSFSLGLAPYAEKDAGAPSGPETADALAHASRDGASPPGEPGP